MDSDPTACDRAAAGLFGGVHAAAKVLISVGGAAVAVGTIAFPQGSVVWPFGTLGSVLIAVTATRSRRRTCAAGAR